MRVTEIVPEAVNPSPETVSFAPAVTVSFWSDMLGVTVNVTGEPVELVDAVSEEESVAATVYGFPLAESGGTVKRQVKLPLLPIEESPQEAAVVPIVTEMVPEAVKFCPVTVSLVPTAEEAEVMEMLGAMEELELVELVEVVVWARATDAPPASNRPQIAAMARPMPHGLPLPASSARLCKGRPSVRFVRSCPVSSVVSGFGVHWFSEVRTPRPV